jgi:ribosomal protein S27E
MCCDGWGLEPGEEVNGECPDCGEETVDGGAAYGCNYSPILCETCGAAPCDLSC